MGHGRALLALNPTKQVETAHLIAHKQLSVRETEKLIKRIEQAPLKKPITQDRDLLRLHEDISTK